MATYTVIPQKRDIKDVMSLLEDFCIVLSFKEEKKRLDKNQPLKGHMLPRADAMAKLLRCETLVELDRAKAQLIVGEIN